MIDFVLVNFFDGDASDFVGFLNVISSEPVGSVDGWHEFDPLVDVLGSNVLWPKENCAYRCTFDAFKLELTLFVHEQGGERNLIDDWSY